MLQKKTMTPISTRSSDPNKSEGDSLFVRLDRFVGDFDRGRSRFVIMFWMLARWLFFDTAAPWPYALKRTILRRFGASVGRGVVLRTRIYIHYPWRLKIGDHCWVGDGCQFMNFEQVTLEDHVALAHEVYLAAGGHDIRSATMQPRNAPIYISTGSWITSRVFIGPGVRIGRNAVIGACSVVMRDIPGNVVALGNPCRVTKERVVDRP